MKISKSDLPGSSLLNNFVHDYADGYSVKLNVKDLTIEQVCKVFFVSGPSWVDALFALRNRIVALVGLKTSAPEKNRKQLFDGFNCEIGQQLGLFKVFDKNEREVILGEDDKHLDFRVSLYLDRLNNTLTVSTLVKVHNRLGWLYFLPVKPVHKLIVPAMVKEMAGRLNQLGI